MTTTTSPQSWCGRQVGLSFPCKVDDKSEASGAKGCGRTGERISSLTISDVAICEASRPTTCARKPDQSAAGVCSGLRHMLTPLTASLLEVPGAPLLRAAREIKTGRKSVGSFPYQALGIDDPEARRVVESHVLQQNTSPEKSIPLLKTRQRHRGPLVDKVAVVA